MSTTINTYIKPLVTITTTCILPPTTTITTDITPIGAMTTISYSLVTMEILVNTVGQEETENQKSTTATWVMGGIVAVMRPIYNYPVNINY